MVAYGSQDPGVNDVGDATLKGSKGPVQNLALETIGILYISLVLVESMGSLKGPNG
jgi:hypothetical protein